MPADHETQSQVKKKAANEKALREGLTRERLRTATFKSVGTAARVHARERKVMRTREGSRMHT